MGGPMYVTGPVTYVGGQASIHWAEAVWQTPHKITKTVSSKMQFRIGNPPFELRERGTFGSDKLEKSILTFTHDAKKSGFQRATIGILR
jgi:hypothetical protein